ncbi:MAG TPA: hypothetical protein VLV54_12155 [Thermoanaerobaculia bacterium]|nr:hypothetical protein [Thermoanaerobaculia bacterium]
MTKLSMPVTPLVMVVTQTEAAVTRTAKGMTQSAGYVVQFTRGMTQPSGCAMQLARRMRQSAMGMMLPAVLVSHRAKPGWDKAVAAAPADYGGRRLSPEAGELACGTLPRASRPHHRPLSET